MSFYDLFAAVHGRDWSQGEKDAFDRLTQGERNEWVRKLASNLAFIKTEDRIGSDGRVYTAFWVERSGN